MASAQSRNPVFAEKSQHTSSSSAAQSRVTAQDKQRPARRKDFGSDGVTDNDIFLLPGSDIQLLGVLSAIATVVRLFRIYQPSSVVFDEVQ